jgi:hypothetical protein
LFIAREKASGTHGSSISLDADGGNRLCEEENRYANTLSLPLSKYGELMDDWMSKKLQKETALTAQTRGFVVFESWPLLSEKRSPRTVLPMQMLAELHYTERNANARARRDFGRGL